MGSFHFDVFVKDVIIVVGLGILVFLCSVIKKSKTYTSYDVTHKNPKLLIFLNRSCKTSESLEGLHSSLAQSPGEL